MSTRPNATDQCRRSQLFGRERNAMRWRSASVVGLLWAACGGNPVALPADGSSDFATADLATAPGQADLSSPFACPSASCTMGTGCCANLERSACISRSGDPSGTAWCTLNNLAADELHPTCGY